MSIILLLVGLMVLFAAYYLYILNKAIAMKKKCGDITPLLNADGKRILCPNTYTTDYVYAVENAAQCSNGALCRKCHGTSDSSVLTNIPILYSADGKWPNKIEKYGEYYVTDGIEISKECGGS